VAISKSSSRQSIKEFFRIDSEGIILSSNSSILKELKVKIGSKLPDDLFLMCQKAINDEVIFNFTFQGPVNVYEVTVISGSEVIVVVEKEDLTDNEHGDIFESLVESAEDILYICNSEGYFNYANKRTLEVTGYSLKELRKKHFLELIHPSYRDELKDFYRKQIIIRAKTSYREFPIAIKDETLIWIGQNVTNIIKDGLVVTVHCVARVITDKVLAESENQKAQKKLLFGKSNLEAIIENTLDAILSVDKNLTITALNSAFRDQFVLFRDSELKEGDNLLNKFDPNFESFKKNWEIYYQEAFNGHDFSLEEKYAIEGKEYYYEISFHPIFNNRDRVTGVSVFARNITTIRKNQQEIKEQQANLTAIIENTNDIVLSVDQNYKLLAFNTSFKKTILSLYNIEPQKGISMLFLNGLHIRQQSWKLYFDRALAGESFNIDEKGIANGSDVFYEVAFNPIISEKNTVTGISIFGRNRTSAKKRELDLTKISSRMISLIQNLQSAILVEDERRKMVYVNKMFCDWFEVPLNPELMRDMDCAQTAQRSKVMFKDPEGYISRIDELLKNRQIVTNEELELVDGKYFERDYIPIYVKGDYNGHLWQHRDITQRKKAEQELIKARFQALESMKAKEQFLSVMSHEIRTPMNAVVGMTHLLLQENPTPQQNEYLNSIKFSAENLLVIINDILDFTKIESGKIDLEEIDFELNDILISLYKTLIFKVEEKNLNFKINVHPKVPGVLKGDPVRLSQILINLISNAVKFTEKGYVMLDVDLVEKEKDHSIIIFKITDTGIGIAAEKMDMIFESFTQSSSDTTRKYGGTGLGLTITKKLVEYLGGNIQVSSELKQGSIFEVVLPIKNSKFKSIIKEEKNHDINQSLVGVKVLLVEDNKMNQVVAVKFLEKWGADVDVAENGVEALEIFSKSDYHLILMDLQMPELDGYETSRIIRTKKGKKGKNVPIIALTASALFDVKNKVLQAGMNDYVTKPFDPYHLYEKVAIHTLKQLKVSVDISSSSIHLTDAKPVNLTYLAGISGGNHEFMAEMITVFLGNTPGILKKMTDEFRNLNYKEVKAIAHKLKANLKMMGIMRSLKPIEEIEKYALEENRAMVKETIDLVSNACEEAYTELNDHLRVLKIKA